MQTEFEKKFNDTPSLRVIKKLIKHRHFLWPWQIRKLRRRFPKVGLKPGTKISGYIEIGEYTYFMGFARLLTYSREKIPEPGIRIGKFNSIANAFYCSTGVDNHFPHLPSTYPVQLFQMERSLDITDSYSSNRINIGNNVWVCRDVSILGNVTIGNGSIVGMSSVVTKDVPAYHVAAGNPARVKKMRFSEAVIEQLEEIAWWDWPLDKIKRNTDFFRIDLRENTSVDLKDHIVD